MATAVLRPQDCSTPIAFVPADVTYASRFVPRPKPLPKSVPSNTRRRRRSPSDQKRSQTEGAKELVMGKVRILKRGDKLSPDSSEEKTTRIDRGRSVTFEKVEAVVLCSMDRLGPDPVVLKEQISVVEKKKKNNNNKRSVVVEDKFAGCVVVAPPPPSSLPMPKKFWMKREETCYDAVSMAVDLRRMLRLDLI